MLMKMSETKQHMPQASNLFWQRATTVIVGLFMGCTRENYNKWYNYPRKFYVTFKVYTQLTSVTVGHRLVIPAI